MKWKFGGKSSLWLGLAGMGTAALGLRCLHLEARPMHTDEAVHAVVLGEMLQTGVYRYNPHDSHGPTLYYLSFPFLRALGVHALAAMEAWQLRLVSALIGTATILTLALWAAELGAGAVLVAGALLTLAAPFVYYQRYFIHEGLFVFLILLLLRCLWAWLRSRDSVALGVATGTVSALLFATKETASLVFLALALAAGGLWLTSGARPRVAGKDRPVSWRSAGCSALAFTLFFTLFYSSFGTNPHGLGDFVSAQFRFAHRAAGEGHEKPWWTYLSWLLMPAFHTVPWSGWIILGLATFGAARGWTLPLVRFLFFFALALGTIFSLIPYKTPWLEIDLLASPLLLAGAGAVALFRDAGRYRPVLVPVAALALLGFGHETWQACFIHATDPRNPLAYSPTVEDVEALAARVGELKKLDQDPQTNFVQVIGTDYWPLPWYLRRLGPVGYWSAVPPAITADIVIASPDLLPAVRSKLGPECKTEYFGLRPDVLVVVVSRTTPR